MTLMHRNIVSYVATLAAFALGLLLGGFSPGENPAPCPPCPPVEPVPAPAHPDLVI